MSIPMPNPLSQQRHREPIGHCIDIPHNHPRKPAVKFIAMR